MRPKRKPFKRYIQLRKQLLKVRNKNDNYWSEHEEPILNEMDTLWSNLNKKELAFIRKQGSWKFSKPKP